MTFSLFFSILKSIFVSLNHLDSQIRGGGETEPRLLAPGIGLLSIVTRSQKNWGHFFKCHVQCTRHILSLHSFIVASMAGEMTSSQHVQ